MGKENLFKRTLNTRYFGRKNNFYDNSNKKERIENLMFNHKLSIKDVLKRELKKEKNEKTTIQIRLFDNDSAKAFYKDLTQEELLNVLKCFDEVEWI